MIEAPQTVDGLIEALAAIEHERWADWQRWLHEQCGVGVGLATRRESKWIPPEMVERWERQIATPYTALSEAEKQSDRDQVARYWPLIVAFVAEWLTHCGCESSMDLSDRGPELAEDWRLEVGGALA